MAHNYKLAYWLIPASLVLLVGTWVVFTFYPRYLPVSGELLINQDFSNKLTAWEIHGRQSRVSLDGNIVTMRIDNSKESLLLIQSLQMLPAGKYKVQADISIKDVVQGAENWHNAGIIVATYNDEGDRSGSYDIATTSGTLPWQTVEQVIEIPSIFPRTDVIARMLKSQGMMKVKKISFKEVFQAPYYNILRLIFIPLWICIGIIALWTLYRLQPAGWVSVTLFITIIAVLLGTLIPKHIISNLNDQLALNLPLAFSATLESIFRDQLNIPLLDRNAQFSKLGHFVVFMALAFVSRLGFSKTSWIRVALMLLYVIVLSETLQLLTNARSAGLVDILIDSAGMILGLMIAEFMLLLFKADTAKT